MRTVIVSAAVLAATVPGVAAAAVAQAAPAAAPARVTVTIQAEGTDMFGTVSSSKPRKCAADRTVKVFKLVAGEPHLWASDTTDLQGGKYVWSTGNTGTEGRFFARVGPKAGCRGDVSPTIRVVRPD